MEKRTLRTRAVPAVFTLLVVVSGCVGWRESESDAIRRVVVAHELSEQGVQVDELIIRLSPGEFRADLGHGSKVVWLVSPGYQRQYREGEYFGALDPERSYLFVQDVTYDNSHNQAMVGLALYLGSGQLTNKEITLHKRDGFWEVSSERLLKAGETGQ